METFIWMHGVSVVAQATNENDPGGNRELRMVPTRYGMQVTQRAGTENDFHIAIPALQHLDGKTTESWHGFLRVRIWNGTEISSLVTTEIAADGRFIDLPQVTQSNHPQSALTKFPILGAASGRVYEVDFNYPDWACRGPLCMTIHVKFDNECKIFFFGAGARFSNQRGITPAPANQGQVPPI